MTGPGLHSPPKVSTEPHAAPFCDDMWPDDVKLPTLTCTREIGHEGQHEAGIERLMDGSVLVIATWNEGDQS